MERFSVSAEEDEVNDHHWEGGDMQGRKWL